MYYEYVVRGVGDPDVDLLISNGLRQSMHCWPLLLVLACLSTLGYLLRQVHYQVV